MPQTPLLVFLPRRGKGVRGAALRAEDEINQIAFYQDDSSTVLPALKGLTGPFSYEKITRILLIGNVPIEQTVKPILGYLGLLFLCLLVIAFVPVLSTALPRAFGY
mgnify:CR=1 FL=1